jgi:hypothetical protein
MAALLRRNWGRAFEIEESTAESPNFPLPNAATPFPASTIGASLACGGAIGEIEPAQRVTVDNSGAI